MIAAAKRYVKDCADKRYLEALCKLGRRRLKTLLLCILLTGTLPVVWLYHRKVLKTRKTLFYIFDRNISRVCQSGRLINKKENGGVRSSF